MILACIWWSLWRERNHICFEDTDQSMDSLRGFTLQSFFLWANAVLGSPFSGFPDFLSFLACLC